MNKERLRLDWAAKISSICCQLSAPPPQKINKNDNFYIQGVFDKCLLETLQQKSKCFMKYMKLKVVITTMNKL